MGGIIPAVAALVRRGVKLPSRLTREMQEQILRGEWPPRTAGTKRQKRPEPEPYPWAVPGRTVTLVLPGWRPESVNTWGRNRWTRKKAVSEARTQLLAAEPLLMLPVEKRPEHLRTYWRPRVQVVIYQSQERYPDPHNHTKSLIDSLKRVGLLREDNHRVIDLPPEQFPVDPVNPRTSVTITERGALKEDAR